MGDTENPATINGFNRVSAILKKRIMKDLLLEKFENSVLAQKETSQILGGKCIISSQNCVNKYYRSDGSSWTYTDSYTDYDDGTDNNAGTEDCDG